MHKLITFRTERLIMRVTGEEDAAFYFALLNSPGWLQYIGDRQVHSEAAAAEYIRTRVLTQQERLGYSSYTMLRAEDGVKMGVCGLYDRAGLEGVDLGFALLPEYYGCGYAFEAADALLDIAQKDLQLTEFLAITSQDNHASIKLLSKLGFVISGTTILPGEEEELYLHILRTQREPDQDR